MKRRVLIIDDVEEQSRTLRDIFELKGYEAYAAQTSDQALALVRENDFDLVFTDLVLKGDKNGVEIFRGIQKLKPGTKVILFTGYGPQEEQYLLRDAIREGMIDEILRKPLWPEEILMVAKKYAPL